MQASRYAIGKKITVYMRAAQKNAAKKIHNALYTRKVTIAKDLEAGLLHAAGEK